MSSKERILLPGVPHYIVHKTRNDNPIFRTTVDFQYCVRQMIELHPEYEILIHAWSVLPTELHLLITPVKDVNELSGFMKAFSCRIALFFKRVHEEDSPWESRFLSTPVQPSQWVLTVMRKIELRPIALGLASRINQYPYSSLRERTDKTQSPWLVDPDEYLRLGVEKEERVRAYREYLRMGGNPKEEAFIDNALNRGLITGSDRYIREMAERYGDRVMGRPRGRPRKHPRPEGDALFPRDEDE